MKCLHGEEINMNVSFAILNWKSILFFKLWFLLLALYFWISFGILRFLFFCLFLKYWRSLDFSFRHSYISHSLAELFSPMTSGSIYMMLEAHTYSLSSRFPYATIRCLHLDVLQDCTRLVFKIKRNILPPLYPIPNEWCHHHWVSQVTLDLTALNVGDLLHQICSLKQ